jgi:geranylgeranyl pyrophosphate synthase
VEAPPAVSELAAALELIHTYSLVHDDLPCMDDDAVRRGRATTHRVYGDDVALLAGAALIPLALRTAYNAASALELSEQGRGRVVHTLAEAAGAAGMVGGQVLDLEGESSNSDMASLERTHGAKTGALLRGACKLGGIAARASEAQLAALDQFGAHLGLAFQIADDILDETATTEQLGKTVGKDRAGSKATFPGLLGLPGATERAATEVTAAVHALAGVDLRRDRLIELCRFAVERKR